MNSTATPSPAQTPLHGLRVVELGQLIAGPFAAKTLADFGADVVKIETPKTGDPLRKWRLLKDGTSVWWQVQSRNKRSVALDLKEKQAQDIKRRLDVTDAVYAAEYNFQIVMGHCYWLVWHKRHNKNLLVINGPDDWSTGVPEDYQYLMQVKYMGDHTWQEVIL